MKIWSMILVAFFSMAVLSSCAKEEGPMEEMGKSIDEAASDVGDAAEDAADEVKEAVED